MASPLPDLPLMPVAPERFSWRGYQVASYRAGAGRPMLLVHSINAAASAFEMREPFDRLRERYAVHAIDLLGYGNSDRPPLRYRPADYIELIGAQLARIGAPTALVASSLGAAYAVAAADRWPDLVSHLVLVCPTGIEQLAARPGLAAHIVYQILRTAVGRGIYRLLTTRAGTRYFLAKQAYTGPASVTPARLAGFYQAGRRPGAYYAPICFLTGMLNCDIAAAFARLRQPTLIIWGRAATTTPLSSADAFLRARPATELSVVDGAALLVQDERPDEFAARVAAFVG